MATFIHITDERINRRILRGGVRANTIATRGWPEIAAPRCGVFCVPVAPNFQATFQWLRELKRAGYRSACGIQFRIDDAEAVYVGHYDQPPQAMTAAEAVAFFLQAEDPRGLEIIVPRRILAREITAIRSIPQAIGWRFYPAAKGREPLWPPAGSIKASQLRRRIEELNESPWKR